MWLLAGLGNPGSAYRLTRHNLGFMVVDRLVEAAGLSWSEKRRAGRALAQGPLDGVEVVWVKPLTYMNRSGEAVGPLARRKGIPAESVVAVHDDLDLPFGRLKVKRGGGAGGHKGVISLQAALGAEGFVRVKMGIGRPETDQPTEAYVLGRFTPEQARLLPRFVALGSDAVRCVIADGLERAMNEYNGREVEP